MNKKAWIVVITVLVIAGVAQAFTWYQYNRVNKAIDTFSYKVEAANDDYDVAKAYLEFHQDIEPMLHPLKSDAASTRLKPRSEQTCPEGQIGYYEGGVWRCIPEGPPLDDSPCPPGTVDTDPAADTVLCGQDSGSGGSSSGGTSGGWFTGLCGSGGAYNDYLCPIGGRLKPKAKVN